MLLTLCAYKSEIKRASIEALFSCKPGNLLCHFGDDAGTDCAATFADGEAQPLLHGYRRQKLDVKCYRVTRHDHFLISWQLNLTCYVGSPEVKLRLVTLKERGVAAALLL